MKNSHRIYRSGFGGHSFQIECNNDAAHNIAEFLFLDFPNNVSATPEKRYNFIVSDSEPIFSLWEDDKQLYSGKSRYQLAYVLMNEVIFDCINHNNTHHALHAGAVYNGDRCIVLPGNSGNGKSTLTSWLIMNGFQYLSDELIFLSPDGLVLPMTRPISLKVNSSHKSWLVPEKCNNEIITGNIGSMIPHRVLNPSFEVTQPKITEIIFPQYDCDAEPVLQRISPARSMLSLLQSHVNARNLDGHGISELSSIIKKCESFSLSYSSFDDLHTFFH